MQDTTFSVVLEAEYSAFAIALLILDTYGFNDVTPISALK